MSILKTLTLVSSLLFSINSLAKVKFGYTSFKVALKNERGKRSVYYYASKRKRFPKGLILLFHGRGGKAQSFFDGSVEMEKFVNKAVAQGFSVLAADSSRRSKKWDARKRPDLNRDVRFIKDMLNRLYRQNKLNRREPLYGVGFSNGGGFISQFAPFLKVKGIALFGSTAKGASSDLIPYLYRGGVIPRTGLKYPKTMFILGDNDSYVKRSDLQQAYASVRALRSKGVSAYLMRKREEALYWNRFIRIEGLSAGNSWAIWSSLYRKRCLSQRGHRLMFNPFTQRNHECLRSGIPSRYKRYQKEIVRQLSAVYAEHAFYSDYAQNILNFFR